MLSKCNFIPILPLPSRFLSCHLNCHSLNRKLPHSLGTFSVCPLCPWALVYFLCSGPRCGTGVLSDPGKCFHALEKDSATWRILAVITLCLLAALLLPSLSAHFFFKDFEIRLVVFLLTSDFAVISDNVNVQLTIGPSVP